MSETKKLNVDDVKGLTVSGKVLAALFNMTDRRVRALAEEGIVVKVTKGKYLLIESVSRYITYIKTNNAVKDGATSSEDYDVEYEEFMLKRAKREEAELKVAAMKGTMHRAEDVECVMNDMLANFKSKLSNVPSKVAPMLVARNEAVTIQKMLTSEIHEVLEELSNYDPIDFYGKDYIDFEEDERDETSNQKQDSVQDS